MSAPILDYTFGGGVPPFSGPGLPVPGPFAYWPSIINLTGGMSATDLDAQSIELMPQNAVVELVIAGRGASQWKKVLDNTTPATNTEGGVVRTLSYDPISNPYVFKRQAGY